MNNSATEIAPSKRPSAPVKKEVIIESFEPAETVFVHHKLDSLLKRINKRHDFHGSVLVAQNGKLIYNNHVGLRDFRTKEEIDENSIFQLASVSKQFTAAAILMLAEDLELHIDDYVTCYYPDFPYEGVTIKHLLNHTAGLPNYFWIAEHKWKGEQAPTNAEMMDLMETSDVERFFTPGRRFDYSNAAYFVLASIVEQVSKKSFADFVDEHIFEPLQMNNSYVYSFEHDKISDNQLIGYRLYRGWRHAKIRGTVNDAVVGDKNVYSTTEDLLKWVNALNNGDLLSEPYVDMMYSKSENKYGRKIPYGFGFRINDKGDNNQVYHYGRWNGFSTALTQYPEDDLVVIILEHTSYNAMTSLNKKIRNIVIDNFEPFEQYTADAE
ncbi:hypothetical protein KH5_04070 [Urechidicola sp. KH5]